MSDPQSAIAYQAQQISELERKANEATERQKELERQIEDHHPPPQIRRPVAFR